MWGLFLFLLSTVSGQELLVNPNFYNGSTTGWLISNAAAAAPATADGFECINVTNPSGSGCPDVYQFINTTIGQNYTFTCQGFSPKYANDFGGWNVGLLVQLNAPPPYQCIGSLSSFKYTWLGLIEPPTPVWKPLQISFAGNGNPAILMLHGDNYGRWACYRNCSLKGNPTSSPTRSPTTLSPTTTSPTRSPTPTGCTLCSTPTCTGLEIRKDPEGCAIVDDLDQVVGWTKSLADTKIARNVICSILAVEAQDQDCHHKLDRSLYEDACETIRGTLYSGFLPNFNAKWCMNATTNFTRPIDEWNSTLAVNYTTVSNKAECVETQQYQSSSSSSSTYAALGPLADVVAHPDKYPNFPPIKVVHSSSRSTGILYNTACLSPQAVNPGWYGALGVFLFLAVLAGGLLFKRRHLSPVKARDKFLMWGSLLFVVVNFVWIAIDQLTGSIDVYCVNFLWMQWCNILSLCHLVRSFFFRKHCLLRVDFLWKFGGFSHAAVPLFASRAAFVVPLQMGGGQSAK